MKRCSLTKGHAIPGVSHLIFRKTECTWTGGTPLLYRETVDLNIMHVMSTSTWQTWSRLRSSKMFPRTIEKLSPSAPCRHSNSSITRRYSPITDSYNLHKTWEPFLYVRFTPNTQSTLWTLGAMATWVFGKRCRNSEFIPDNLVWITMVSELFWTTSFPVLSKQPECLQVTLSHMSTTAPYILSWLLEKHFAKNHFGCIRSHHRNSQTICIPLCFSVFTFSEVHQHISIRIVHVNLTPFYRDKGPKGTTRARIFLQLLQEKNRNLQYTYLRFAVKNPYYVPRHCEPSSDFDSWKKPEVVSVLQLSKKNTYFPN